MTPHTLGPCEVLVNAYRKELKKHESRWEKGIITGIISSLPDEDLPYRVNVKPLHDSEREYVGCHPDCVRQ